MNEGYKLPYWRITRDKGCDVASSCLACPLKACKFDDLVGYHDWQKRQEDTQHLEHIRHLRTEGVSFLKIAMQLGINQYQISRILERAR